MQWDPSSGAGFTTNAKPWLPIPPSSAAYNVATESKDPNSIFNTYKRLLALRKTDPAIRDGSQESVNNDDPNVFAYLRRGGKRTVLVALNMSSHPHTVAFHLGATGIAGTRLTPLYSAPPASGTIPLDRVELPPFAALVAAVE
jgi:alpha-glucosidase